MAHVTVKINGYAYTVGCEDGQEQHLQAMAGQVEKRIDSIKALGGNTGEARLLVLASLLMADEIHDLRAELDAVRRAPRREPAMAAAAPAAAPPAPKPELAHALGRLAVRAEEIAASLEGQ
ncbi:MAG: cell division protein ZapA [Rhodospirillales bacterium]|nr:cell division protein ZapA [Rhodospirillales bacterium]